MANNCRLSTNEKSQGRLKLNKKGDRILCKVKPEDEDLSKLHFRGIPGTKLVEAFYKSYGILTLVISYLDLGKQREKNKIKNETLPLKNYINQHPILKKYLDESRAGIVDKAEKVMIELMDSDSEKIRYEATRFVLDRLGAANGWMGNKLNTATQIEITQHNDEEKKKKILQIFNISSQPSEEKTLMDIPDEMTREEANPTQTNVIKIEMNDQNDDNNNNVLSGEVIDVQSLNKE